jgi:hypothetical protein
MPTLAELSAKVDELQGHLDTEQQEVADAIAALQAAVADLTASGGSDADRQAVADKINAVITDLQGTISNAPPTPEP